MSAADEVVSGGPELVGRVLVHLFRCNRLAACRPFVVDEAPDRECQKEDQEDHQRGVVAQTPGLALELLAQLLPGRGGLWFELLDFGLLAGPECFEFARRTVPLRGVMLLLFRLKISQP